VDGPDHLLIGGLVHHFAHLADRVVEGRLADELHAPHLLEELLFRNDTVSVSDEKDEDVERAGLQPDRVAPPAKLESGFVELHPEEPVDHVRRPLFFEYSPLAGARQPAFTDPSRILHASGETFSRQRHTLPGMSNNRFAMTAVSLLVLSRPLSAENLVRNGTFNVSVGEWPAEDSSALVSWNALDAGASPSSGSALVSNVSAGPQNGIGIHQCVFAGITGGATYAYGGRVRIPSGQARTGFFMIGLRWYASPDCTGTPLDQVGVDTRVLDTWVLLRDVSVAPGNARSVEPIAFPSKVEAGGQLQGFFDDIFLSPSLVTIPSSASIHGAGGTFFHSDLWVMNLSGSAAAAVTARYRCFTGQTCDTAPRTLTLGPRASALYSDAVSTLFSSPETAGAIELAFDPTVGDIAATSRVYTPGLPAPTYGASVPGQLSNRASTRALFLGLGSSGGDARSGFRTNAGAYNPNASAVAVTFSLHQANGSSLGVPLTRTWGAHETFQINGLFAAVGAGGAVATDAWLAVTASSPIFPFVTVIDNQSGDSTWVVPWEDTGSAP
jgi:hypothetical protein